MVAALARQPTMLDGENLKIAIALYKDHPIPGSSALADFGVIAH
jgi:hypothetical protein